MKYLMQCLAYSVISHYYTLEFEILYFLKFQPMKLIILISAVSFQMQLVTQK